MYKNKQTCELVIIFLIVFYECFCRLSESHATNIVTSQLLNYIQIYIPVPSCVNKVYPSRCGSYPSCKSSRAQREVPHTWAGDTRPMTRFGTQNPCHCLHGRHQQKKLTLCILAMVSGKCAVSLVFPISVAEVIMTRKKSVGRFRCPTSGWPPQP